jgi:beta-glucanase (GH16 family)
MLAPSPTMTAIEPPGSLPAAATPERLIRLASLTLLAAATFATAQQKPSAPGPQWHLSWSDEFNGSNGSPPDPAKWSFDVGGNGYGNNELESYTSRIANAEQRDGNLLITARKEEYQGPDGLRHYTSARIRTQGHFSQAYGRFEARIKLPLGKGLWPAFWMLGDDITTADWPKCGEIDIFENIGEPSVNYSTLHGPGYSGAHGLSTKYQLPAGETVNGAFHLYALEWSPADIKFFLDGNLVAEKTPANLPPGTTWVYDHPFFIILNLAVGGYWPGNPDATTVFPQPMQVDYVRVYTRDSTAASASLKKQ